MLRSTANAFASRRAHRRAQLVTILGASAAAAVGMSACSRSLVSSTVVDGTGGGTTSTGIGGAGGTCPGGLAQCGDECVDTQLDPAHCGGCDKPCSQGLVCSQGACTLVCAGGTTKCGGQCVDVDTDPQHCGSCGHACAAGELCSSAQCASQCLGGATYCNGKCVDTAIDPQNCGTCGSACPAGETCQMAQCVSVCSGTTFCGGGCVDTDVDPVNCGGCGMVCPAGSACSSASCVPFTLGATPSTPGQSCLHIFQSIASPADGAYWIDPNGGPTSDSFRVYCDMTRDGGGWTLILKADGTPTLQYDASYWTDMNLLNAADVTVAPGNAKYGSFLTLPVTTLRGELDGVRFTKAFGGAVTARQIFQSGPDLVSGAPPVDGGNWSYQPNCQKFGTNTPYEYDRVRFGWTANQEDDCGSNDTAIGLGLGDIGGAAPAKKGAGYACLFPPCSQGVVNIGGNGLLWVR